MIPNRIGVQGARVREKILPVQMALPSHLLMVLIPGPPPGTDGAITISSPQSCSLPAAHSPHPF